MTDKDEALKMAIEVIEAFGRGCDSDDYFMDISEAINACKEALEQPAQEPVAFIYQNNFGYPSLMWNPSCPYEYESVAIKQSKIPLYLSEH